MADDLQDAVVTGEVWMQLEFDFFEGVVGEAEGLRALCASISSSIMPFGASQSGAS
jgi:hypothetical protein